MKYPKILENRCKCCNGEIIAKRKRDLENEFCGSKCVGKFFRTREKEFVNCEFCGKEFLKTCKTLNKFCSKDCSNKSRITIHLRNCEKCGKQFKLKNIADERRGKGRFCSLECGTSIFEYDETYFEKIENEEKAYWLGFIYADGYCGDKEFRIHLSIKDIKHLEKFKSNIKSTHPIHICKNEKITFNIGRKKIVNDLHNLGVIPRKTFLLNYPDISQELNRHFIRGFFDGDGCIYISKKGYKNFSIFTVAKKFKNKLIDIIKLETGIKLNDNNQGNGWVVGTSKKCNVEEIRQYLYDDANVFLERKRNKFFIK